MVDRACRKCNFIISENSVFFEDFEDEEAKKRQLNRCSNCNSTDLSEDFSGMVIIIQPEVSEIAKRMQITKPGRYALRVR